MKKKGETRTDTDTHGKRLEVRDFIKVRRKVSLADRPAVEIRRRMPRGEVADVIPGGLVQDLDESWSLVQIEIRFVQNIIDRVRAEKNAGK